jgi:L-gulonolactone oxidase
MVRAFLELGDRFRRERGFVLPLPTLIYFIRRDEASLLSRSRQSDMMAVDPTYPDPADADWQAFRAEFNGVALRHGGIPHINKTRGGAITCFKKSFDPEVIRAYLQKREESDPKGLFYNSFFRSLFA